jgi:uncharacterized membrane protein (DUF106 family)
MLAKYWKKILFVILIIACLINIMSKLVNKVSLNTELKESAQYLYQEYQEENKK